MAQAIKKGGCLARGQETSALCSPCFRKSVELLTLKSEKGGESTSALCSPCFRKSVELLTLKSEKGGESWAW